jgi:hypothetical protein
MYTARKVAEMLAEGKTFTSEEVEKILEFNGMSKEKIQECREKGYDDDRLLGLLRFCM